MKKIEDYQAPLDSSGKMESSEYQIELLTQKLNEIIDYINTLKIEDIL